MFYVLSKVLSCIADPVVWIVVCFILSVLFRKRLARRIAFWTGITLFILMGNGALISLAERHWVRNITEPLPEGVVYEYALIQGGFGDFNTATGKSQLFGEAERLIEPVRLYRAGRVKKLYVTGDGTFLNNRFLESRLVFIRYLESMGVPGNDIILDIVSRNTRQSAMRTKELLGRTFNGKNSLLVTSAIHMPRTLKCYRKEGMDPIPFATSVPVPYKIDLTNFNLSSGNLDRWRVLIHEWIGIIVYRITGFV
jgi:uncharacterized SAM-binding protein YcdF (DUF218 family)